MKKFLMGLMLSWVAMFSFSGVGSCMTEQTIKSAYLPIRENSWLKSEIERQAQEIRYIKNLPEDWYQKVMVPSKAIVEKRLRTADGSPILVKKILQNPITEFILSIPIEDEYGLLGPQIASFYVKVKNDINAGPIERILKLNKPSKPKRAIEAKLLNSFGAGGTTCEEEIGMMEAPVADDDIQQKGTELLQLRSNLSNTNMQIIPVSIGTCAGGWILARNEEEAIDQSFIWFTYPLSGYERRKFYKLDFVLNNYWRGIELKEQVFKAPSYEFPIPS
ncbi:MAG: hypothetical protein LBF82_03745 [Lactobacillales bacterium]|jgi:hypothetical protein|nr:hypothetical protein [Lactobacillales bacterium]